MTGDLVAGTRNSYVHLYDEGDGEYILSLGSDEYRVDEDFADRFERLNVDGDEIRKREERGDW